MIKIFFIFYALAMFEVYFLRCDTMFLQGYIFLEFYRSTTYVALCSFMCTCRCIIGELKLEKGGKHVGPYLVLLCNFQGSCGIT